MKILVSSLEASANLHLKEILAHMDTEYELVGIFDKNLGQTPLYDSKEFSVMGIIDVFAKIFKAKEALAEMLFLAKDADKIILIDAPAFNINLLQKIKQKYPQKEVIYYILPKVWAWKKSRAKYIDKYADYPISIFPFEDKYYQQPLYYGNPLVDEIKETKKEPTKEINTIAYLAGSRRSEIKSLMPYIKELRATLDDKKSILVVPPHFSGEEIDKYYGDISDFEISHDTHSALNSADFAFVCSGTATLEASLIGVPFILMYKAKSIDYMIASMFVSLKHVGLANIILGYEDSAELHPELVQNNLTIENLLNLYKNYDIDNFYKNVVKLREILKGGCSKEIAKLLQK
jgi:lipid-A-disaccharide synthase